MNRHYLYATALFLRSAKAIRHRFIRSFLLTLITVAVFFGPAMLQAQESTFRLTVLAYQWTTAHKTITFSWPGYANTSCNGNVNMNAYASGGNIYASGTTSDTCSTTYTPPTNQNIDIQKPVVFILADTETSRMVLTCTRNVRWSQCNALNPGTFLARIDGGHLEVEGTFGKGKERWVKFDVVRQTAITPTPPPPRPPAQVASISSQASTNVEIEIASTPSGADIELDGNFIGSTPSTIGVAGGDHVIIVKKNGYRPWERKIKTGTGKVNIAAELEADIRQEQKTEAAVPVQAAATPVAIRETVAAPPSEVPGKIFVTSSPVGAEIYADSLFLERTPFTMKLKPGQHSILLLMKDYKNWSQTIKADAGSEVQLTATLEKSN